MKLAIELNPTQSARLESVAAELGVNPEDLAQAAIADFISTDANDFESAATRVLSKNSELYQRLSK